MAFVQGQNFAVPVDIRNELFSDNWHVQEVFVYIIMPQHQYHGWIKLKRLSAQVVVFHC